VKKLLALLVLTGFIAVAAGCGGTTTPAAKPAATPPAGTPPPGK
jgi:hypothetical protein